MDYLNMTKEQLIKEIENLNKQLNRKKVDRLAWKKIIGQRFIYGENHWGNGHFAFYADKVEIPKAVQKLDSFIGKTETDINLERLIDDTYIYKPSSMMEEHAAFDSYPENIELNEGIRFDKKYIKMIEKVCPDYLIKTNGMKAAIIYKKDDIVGVIMPLSNKEYKD